jgi:hypothetical protein
MSEVIWRKMSQWLILKFHVVLKELRQKERNVRLFSLPVEAWARDLNNMK